MRTNSERSAGRSEEDRYSRVRSINKTADAPMHAPRLRYLERMRAGIPSHASAPPLVPCRARAKLNSRKRCIGSFELQTAHGALPPRPLISTLDRSLLSTGTSRMQKRGAPKRRRGITAMMKDEFPAIRMDY